MFFGLILRKGWTEKFKNISYLAFSGKIQSIKGSIMKTALLLFCQQNSCGTERNKFPANLQIVSEVLFLHIFRLTESLRITMWRTLATPGVTSEVFGNSNSSWSHRFFAVNGPDWIGTNTIHDLRPELQVEMIIGSAINSKPSRGQIQAKIMLEFALSWYQAFCLLDHLSVLFSGLLNNLTHQGGSRCEHLQLICHLIWPFLAILAQLLLNFDSNSFARHSLCKQIY